MEQSRSQQQTPAEFARELLNPGAIASRYLADTSDDIPVLSDYKQCSVEVGYGGWPEYHSGTVEQTQPLKNTRYTGRRVDSMRREEVRINGTCVGAFVTQYGKKGPKIGQAQSQMAVWAFSDALGLHVPRHHWYPERKIVVVEEVGGPAERTFDPISVDSAVAERIEPTELLDYISILLLAGVEDLRHKNFKIGEEGKVYVFDFDKADQRFGGVNPLSIACGKAMNTIDLLNKARDGEIPIDRDQICSRVQELARDIHSSPHFNRILGTVELYDDRFKEETDISFEDQFRNNITVFSSTNE